MQDLDATFYSSLGLKYEAAFGHDQGLLAFLDRVIPQLPAKCHILDAGCGTGKPVAATLAAAGHHVTGLDISAHMTALSKKAVPSGDFHVVDMRAYIPPHGVKFDAVFNILSLFVLDREEIEEMTAKWMGWLKPDGLLCVCTIAAEDLDPEERGGKYDADGLCVRDIRERFMGNDVQSTLFTREGWKRLLTGKGFTIKETRTARHVPPPEADCDFEDHYFIVAQKNPCHPTSSDADPS